MKKGASIWMFPPGTSLPEAMKLAQKAGYKGLEPALGPNEQLDISATDSKVRGLRRKAEALGIEIASLVSQSGWNCPLLTRDKKEYAEAKRQHKQSLRVARLLGAKTILVVPGRVTETMPYDEAYDRTRQALIELAPEAKAAGVVLGVENVWNKFLLSPLEMARLIDEVNSPFVGAFFDVGNVLVNGYPEQWIRILGKRIKHVHVKDFSNFVSDINGFRGLLDGSVNWPEVMKALREVGYKGHLTSEVCGPNPIAPEHLLYSTSKALDKILSL
jgi:L-ribulose-5-phosphate 3-epimerase